jgi:hypothetical protein
MIFGGKLVLSEHRAQPRCGVEGEILARSERVDSGPAIKLAKGRARVSKREREAAE